MSSPRNIYPDTTLYVTCRAVHRSYRLVPTRRVRKAIRYAFAVASSKYRSKWCMEFYEFEFLSNHYHLLVYDRFGKIGDFLKEFNSVLARELNAIRGTGDSVFAREPGIQTDRAGKPVLGMKAAENMHWSTVPGKEEEMFTRRPTFSTQTAEQRRQMKRLRREFLREYREALARFNAGQRNVVFPAGTVRMRLRHNVLTEPVPLDLLLAA